MKNTNAYGGILQNLLLPKSRERKDIHRRLLTLPRLNLNRRQLCDLELLMNGGYSPLNGFFTEDEYSHVLSDFRLPNKIVWSIPIVLDVDAISKYKLDQDICLCDEYGKPIAQLSISSIYPADKKKEAKIIYGTTNTEHFGVRYLMHKTGNYYLGGKITGIDTVDRFDFINLRKTPEDLRELFRKKNWDEIIGFQTRNPLHKAHVAMIKHASKKYKAKVLIHPSVGMTKDGDIDYITRVRIYKKIIQKYMKSFSVLSLLPYAMRMAGPTEALLHAIIRKNYGCTHFIIGRDHAGPGVVNKKSMYEPYEAQKFVKSFQKDLGIEIITFKEMLYVKEKNTYLPEDEVPEFYEAQKISGTEVRQMLRSNKNLPAWFSYKETIEELKKSLEREKNKGLTLFLTGLPSSGKSTIARTLYFLLLELQDKQVTLLDGDVIRNNLSKGLGFSREDRNINISRIGFIANEITKHGGIAICSAVAPYQESRQINRELISGNGTYIEIYVATPLSVCKKRDVKGLYENAQKGNLISMTGIDDPYDIPVLPELIINTVGVTPKFCARKIIAYLKAKHLITTA